MTISDLNGLASENVWFVCFLVSDHNRYLDKIALNRERWCMFPSTAIDLPEPDSFSSAAAAADSKRKPQPQRAKSVAAEFSNTQLDTICSALHSFGSDSKSVCGLCRSFEVIPSLGVPYSVDHAIALP